MKSDPLATWRSSFGACVQQPLVADRLKAASLKADLKSWTSDLTTVVVNSCSAIGWDAAAKKHPYQRLPKAGQEFLGVDIMAFLPAAEDKTHWPMPLAAFELENSRSDRRVAYSLWKVLCIRAKMRVVFAYRPDWELGRRLVGTVCDHVIGALKPEEQSAIDGQVVMVVGNRGEGETFPWGYFKFWLLNRNLGRFEKI
jgi:hypothetical protein